jgi:hypothetical protein
MPNEVNDTGAIIAALSVFSVAVTGEHLFSTFLSSPWTTQKFAETDEDKRIVWKLYGEAAAFTLIFSVIMAYLLKSWLAVATGIIIVIGYGVVYNEALEHRL